MRAPLINTSQKKKKDPVFDDVTGFEVDENSTSVGGAEQVSRWAPWGARQGAGKGSMESCRAQRYAWDDTEVGVLVCWCVGVLSPFPQSPL